MVITVKRLEGVTKKNPLYSEFQTQQVNLKTYWDFCTIFDTSKNAA